MKIITLNTSGISQAVYAMRHPMESYNRSDTRHGIVGEKDKELSIKLQTAGPEHAKHLRMIMVWADITAPRYWLTELDTYRMGVEKISCSTMHKIMSRPVEPGDFENDQCNEVLLNATIKYINNCIESSRTETDPERKAILFRRVIQHLPQSYLQKRTYMFSYAALRNIVNQREGHKLKEWAQFINWCRTLPESWMIFD